MILMMTMARNLTLLSGWVGSKLKTSTKKPLVNWLTAPTYTSRAQELGLAIDSQSCEDP